MKDQTRVLTDFSLLKRITISICTRRATTFACMTSSVHLVEGGPARDTVRGLGTQRCAYLSSAISTSGIPERIPWPPRWDQSGIWEGFIPNVGKGSLYKYHIVSNHNQYSVNKGDPFAFFWETPPRTASMVWDLEYPWGDEAWLKKQAHNSLNAPRAFMKSTWARGDATRATRPGC